MSHETEFHFPQQQDTTLQQVPLIQVGIHCIVTLPMHYVLLKQVNLLIPDLTGPMLGAPIPPAKTPIIAPPKQRKIMK